METKAKSSLKIHKSNWRQITIIGERDNKVFRLDDSGRLVDKFPKQKPRKDLFECLNQCRINIEVPGVDKPLKEITVSPVDQKSSNLDSGVEIQKEAENILFDSFLNEPIHEEGDEFYFIDYDFNQTFNDNFGFDSQNVNDIFLF